VKFLSGASQSKLDKQLFFSHAITNNLKKIATIMYSKIFMIPLPPDKTKWTKKIPKNTHCVKNFNYGKIKIQLAKGKGRYHQRTPNTPFNAYSYAMWHAHFPDQFKYITNISCSFPPTTMKNLQSVQADMGS